MPNRCEALTLVHEDFWYNDYIHGCDRDSPWYNGDVQDNSSSQQGVSLHMLGVQVGVLEVLLIRHVGRQFRCWCGWKYRGWL